MAEMFINKVALTVTVGGSSNHGVLTAIGIVAYSGFFKFFLKYNLIKCKSFECM